MNPKRTALPDIDTARCTGCGWCVTACRPHHLLSLERQGWVKCSTLHDRAGCTGCGACAAACPFGVIAMLDGAVLMPG